MMNPINFFDLEKATGRISCGNKGTGFLISPQLVLTAAHVVKENKKNRKPISIEFLNIGDTIIERECSLLEYDLVQFDFAILELNKPVTLTSYVPLQSSEVANGENYTIYGYPNEAYTEGRKLENTVSRTQESNTIWDIDLNLKTPFSRKGLSGSALFINGYAVGIIHSQLDNSLHAVSIKKVKSLLEKHQIPFVEKKLENDIPPPLHQQVEATLDTSNTPVFEELDEMLSKANAAYNILTGSPGSGKTTIVTSYSPQKENIEIAGKYFIKIPNDTQAPTIRSSKERLLEWLELVCTRILYNKTPEKIEKNFNKRLEAVNTLLLRLNEHYKSRAKKGVFIIDGLDDALENNQRNLSNFLSILPQHVPQNLCFLFSCTSKSILPNFFQSHISADKEVKVTPLEKDKTERFIIQELDEEEIQLPIHQITQIASKSEGHPLYLRYLVNYIIKHKELLQDEDKNWAQWINNIPIIDGNIRVYYQSIWQTIKEQSEEVRIVATISRLRQKALKESVIQMLPEGSRERWDVTYNKVLHLFNEEKTNHFISIYHASFGEFINNETQTSSTIIHKRIAQFCLNNQKVFYGLSHLIYHLYNSNDTDRAKAILSCRQAWVDTCALQNVAPDFTLTDIQVVLKLCFEYKKAVEVIRILLLLQRIRFRYDSIFKENAFELAETLMAMGKTREAVRYIIRDETLLVSIRDGGYIFQKLIDKEDFDSADEILRVLEKSINNQMQDSEFDQNTLFDFMYIISLEIPFDAERAFRKFSHFKNVISRKLQKWGNTKDVILHFKDYNGGFHHAYMTWNLEITILASEIEKFGYPLDKYTAGYLGIVLLNLKQLKQTSIISKEIPSYFIQISEIENTIDRFSYYSEHRHFLIEALMPDSKRTDIVEKLIKDDLPNSFEFSIRDEGGVNADIKNILKQIKTQTYLGYIHDASQLQSIPEFIYWDNWEVYIISLIKNIGYLFGKAYRYKAENNQKSLDKTIVEFKKHFSQTHFSLKKRVDWREKRAYTLPEEVFPIFYRHIAQFYVTFHPEGINDFIDHIIKKSDDQLGLYTEGYRNSVFEIAYVLVKVPSYRMVTFKLLKRLEKHIYLGVQNRWERAPELMKMAELYALIGAEEKAKDAYKMMLDTSMGISWYKEAQLDLITTTIENLHTPDVDFTNIATFAGHLDFASGEMTFQRYIRMAKENFVNSLCVIGCLDKAIRYFKQITLSTPLAVLQRAESSTIDTPIIGEGYELGAREIEEENAILQLLSALGDELNIYLKWTLCELFVSDDIHYLDSFAKLFGKMISDLEKPHSEQKTFLLNRLVVIIEIRIERPFQDEFIRGVYYQFQTKETYQEFHHLLIEKGLVKAKENKPTYKNEDEILPIIKERRNEEENIVELYTQKAKEELAFGNKTKARNLLKEGWDKKLKDKFSIFDSDYGDSFKVLNEASDSAKDILDTCEDIILNDPYKEEWSLASKLIRLLGKKIDTNKKNELLETVLQHLDLMLRTSEQNNDIFKRYDWLKNKSTMEATNIQIAKFIIWLLNYPNFNASNIIIDLVSWLCFVETNLVLPIVVTEAFDDSPNISTELAMSILYKVAKNNGGQLIWQNIKAKEADILGEHHFIKKYTLVKILEVISSTIPEAKPLYVGLQATFTQTKLNGSDVEPEWQWLQPIEHLFTSLQCDGFINGKICRELEMYVEEICKQLKINSKDLARIHRYYARSFYAQKNFISPIQYIPRYALNTVLGSKIPLSEAAAIAAYLTLHNIKLN